MASQLEARAGALEAALEQAQGRTLAAARTQEELREKVLTSEHYT